MTAETIQDSLIRERAYKIWEREGRPDGRAREHWEQAAKEIKAEQQSPPWPAARRPPTSLAAKAPPARRSRPPAK